MLIKLKNNCKQIKGYFSRGPVIALIIIVIVLLSVGIYTISLRKDINIAVGNKVTKVVTYKSTVREILEQNKIVLGSKDKVKPGLDTKVENGQEINIKRAVSLEVLVDGKDLKIKSSESSVAQMLNSEKIALSDVDKINVDKKTPVAAGLKVVITRVNSKTITETQPIAFETVVQKDDTIGNDEQKVVQQGATGSKEVTTNITYEDGKEVSRNIVSEIVKSNPVQAIIKQGTLGVVKANRGERVLYKNKISVKATAYTASPKFGITASGTRTKRDVNGYSSIAVDPRVIPLGTKLYVPGYGYGIAEDTGGAIKGNRVDLFLNSEGECYNWGVRNVDVYIIN